MKLSGKSFIACALALVFCTLGTPGTSETLRIATYNVDLSRKGPGLLLRDINREKDLQVRAVQEVIATVRPDVIALQGFDYDAAGHALSAFQKTLSRSGHPMPYSYSARPNSGVATGLDMDGNGKTNEPRDAQGYGRFTGQGGMAILSRLPLGDARDFTSFLWKDLPDAIPPHENNKVFPSPEAFAIQRLSSVAHWDVEVMLPDHAALHVLTFHATTPVFDGPEDRNGRRSHDEITFWPLLLDGALPFASPSGPFVIVGDANLDPVDGDGRQEAIHALLARSDVQDPHPQSAGGVAATDTDQSGDPALDTVDWPDGAPGNLRVSYVLPSRDLEVVGSGVFWPAPDDPLHETVETASRHRLVWVDIRY